jgi:hypothetical protein
MALHKDLPIYKAAYDLLSVTTEITRNIPRDFKRLIGEKVREECVEVIVLIFKANVSFDKVPHIQILLERVQVVELLLRLSRDKHFISTKQYAGAIDITDQIGKQATGWKKHQAASPAAELSGQLSLCD